MNRRVSFEWVPRFDAEDVELQNSSYLKRRSKGDNIFELAGAAQLKPQVTTSQKDRTTPISASREHDSSEWSMNGESTLRRLDRLESLINNLSSHENHATQSTRPTPSPTEWETIHNRIESLEGTIHTLTRDIQFMKQSMREMSRGSDQCNDCHSKSSIIQLDPQTIQKIQELVKMELQSTNELIKRLSARVEVTEKRLQTQTDLVTSMLMSIQSMNEDITMLQDTSAAMRDSPSETE